MTAGMTHLKQVPLCALFISARLISWRPVTCKAKFYALSWTYPKGLEIQLHSPLSLALPHFTPQKEYEAQYVPKPVWMFWIKKLIPLPTLEPWPFQPIASSVIIQQAHFFHCITVFFKILWASIVLWNEFHSEDSQTLGDTVQNFVPWATLHCT
jgi:hypothetical protein